MPVHRRPADLKLARVGLQSAEDQLGGLGASRTQQARQSDDLAAAQLQVERLHCQLSAEALGLQDHRRIHRRPLAGKA